MVKRVMHELGINLSHDQACKLCSLVTQIKLRNKQEMYGVSFLFNVGFLQPQVNK
jgi:hypothetical protein